jgi:hypothetical protein
MSTAGGADDELIALLKHALEDADPVPADAVRAAKEAWTWRTIDAELAALTYDSVVDEGALVGVRGTAAVRSLAFETGAITIEVELVDDGDRRGLRGQVVGASAPAVVLEFSDGRSPIVMLTDELGRFGADRLDGGVARLRIPEQADPAGEGAAGGATGGSVGGLVTEWVPI